MIDITNVILAAITTAPPVLIAVAGFLKALHLETGSKKFHDETGDKLQQAFSAIKELEADIAERRGAALEDVKQIAQKFQEMNRLTADFEKMSALVLDSQKQLSDNSNLIQELSRQVRLLIDNVLAMQELLSTEKISGPSEERN